MIRERSCTSDFCFPLPLCKIITSSGGSSSLHGTFFKNIRIPRLRIHGPVRKPRFERRAAMALMNGDSIQDLSNNKVLVAVVTAMILGQALKPFTAALRGKGLNWKLLISSGGMPSSHSASVTAACTAIAMDRGLADPLFGLAVVFAGIVMYDAQGVRRAVGKHAEVINTFVVGYDYQSLTGIQTDRQLETQSGDDLTSRGFLTDESSPNVFSAAGKQQSNETFSINDRVRNGRSYQRPQNFIEAAKKLPSVEAGDVDIAELSDSDGWRHIPLKESVGHTEAEVVVGGIWGIFCTIVLSTVFSH